MESPWIQCNVVALNSQSGKVEIFMNVIESKIQDIKIYGDFFGIEDVAAVKMSFRGSQMNAKTFLKPYKQTINLGRYRRIIKELLRLW